MAQAIQAKHRFNGQFELYIFDGHGGRRTTNRTYLLSFEMLQLKDVKQVVINEKHKAKLLQELQRSTEEICKGGVSYAYKFELLKTSNATAVMVHGEDEHVFGGAVCSLKTRLKENDTMFIETICSLGGGFQLILALHAFYRVVHKVEYFELHSLTTPLGFYASKLNYTYRAHFEDPENSPVTKQISDLLTRIEVEVVKSPDPEIQQLYRASAGNDAALVQNFKQYRELVALLQPMGVKNEKPPCDTPIDESSAVQFVADGCTVDGYFGWRLADQGPQQEKDLYEKFKALLEQGHSVKSHNIQTQNQQEIEHILKKSRHSKPYGGSRRIRRTKTKRRSSRRYRRFA
jgi:hypothetical protein